MKLYKPKPQRIIRITISRAKEPKEYLNFIETTHIEVINNLNKLIQNYNDPSNCKGDKTRLDIRECIGGKNGKSKSISFTGMSVSKIKKEILKKYKN